MQPGTHLLTLPGAMLQRGFWLYVWRVETPKGEFLYVVFTLNEQQWAAFNEALDRPPETNEALASMLRTKAPWA